LQGRIRKKEKDLEEFGGNYNFVVINKKGKKG